MSDQYDDELGPPVCQRCGEECHWCTEEFKDEEAAQEKEDV